MSVSVGGGQKKKSECRVIETDYTSLDYLGLGRDGVDCQKTQIVMCCVCVCVCGHM